MNARIAEKKKDFPTAEQEYRAAISASHGSASAWLNLGLFYRHRERWDDMEQALTHVRGAPLDRPDALVDAAEILLALAAKFAGGGAIASGLPEFQRQGGAGSGIQGALLLGTADEEPGDREGAATEYRSALDLAHEFQPAQQALQRVNR